MNERALFTDFWTKEATTTRNVIARIPEGSDYRPDPKSRTAKDIAWQIVCEEKMIIDALETGKTEWAPAEMPATMKEVWSKLRRAVARIRTPRGDIMVDDVDHINTSAQRGNSRK